MVHRLVLRLEALMDMGVFHIVLWEGAARRGLRPLVGVGIIYIMVGGNVQVEIIKWVIRRCRMPRSAIFKRHGLHAVQSREI